ncbi:hypothetical protein BN14_09551 [Rhizoctonia solani AG-1 IB]|nr:hypothetical protein BN14_09551 [Rhizoctonia solani AG-1 IB]
MVNKITNYVSSVFSPLINKGELNKKIESIISNPKTNARPGAAGSAPQLSTGISTGVIAALPGSANTSFHVLLATIKFTREVAQKPSWYTSKAPVQTKNLVAQVTGIRLIVDSSFQPLVPPSDLCLPPPPSEYGLSTVEFVPRGKNNTSPEEATMVGGIGYPPTVGQASVNVVRAALNVVPRLASFSMRAALYKLRRRSQTSVWWLIQATDLLLALIRDISRVAKEYCHAFSINKYLEILQ